MRQFQLRDSVVALLFDRFELLPSLIPVSAPRYDDAIIDNRDYARLIEIEQPQRDRFGAWRSRIVP